MARLISVNLPEAYLEALDELKPKYGSRSEAIRVAIERLIENHKGIEYNPICNDKVPLCKRPYKIRA